MTGEELDKILAALGMTSTQAADFFEINPTTLRRYRRGWPIPMTFALLMILLREAHVAGFDIDALRLKAARKK